jgi:hypothetical protein
MKARAVPTTDKGWQTYLESLQAPSERRWIAMGGGLALCSDTSGTKTFQARLRDSKGASQRIRIGTFPTVSVAAARYRLLDIKAAMNRSPAQTRTWNRARALGKLLQDIEQHRVDWRAASHIKRAMAEVQTQADFELELYLGAEMAAGWLGWLINEIALDPNASDRQRQVVIAAASGIMTNGALAWAAADRMDDKSARRLTEEQTGRLEDKRRQTEDAAAKTRENSAIMGEVIFRHADADRRRHPSASDERIAANIHPKVNDELRQMGHENRSRSKRTNQASEVIGVDAIAARLRRRRLS